jgi:sarcosine oxidase subunit beta
MRAVPDRARGYEVAVLGAGCAGAAAAYALARRRIAPVVVDTSRPDGAVPASAAVAVQSGTPADIRLAVRSAERFPELQDAIGGFEYRRTGGLTVALTDADAEMGRARAAQAGAAGLPVVWLSREETLRREPGLTEHTAGAVYCGYDGVADPGALARRLLAAALGFGGAAHLDCGYISIARQNGGFRIRAGRDEIVARRVVVASMELLGMTARQLGAGLPARSGRRRVGVTERIAPLLRHTVNGIRQHPSGELVLDPPALVDEGATAENAGALVEALRRIAAGAVCLVPRVEPARIIHAPLLFSAAPADGRPAVGRLEDDLYFALAGADRAVTYCPVIGDAIAEAVSRNRWPDGLDIWAPGRFAVATAGAGTAGGLGPDRGVQDSSQGS